MDFSPMVSVNDYAGMDSFAGIGTAGQVAALNKALNTGAYAQANGIAGQTNGAALQVESLESALKVLTFSDKQLKLWPRIPKTPAYSTVEEYNQLVQYGSQTNAFVAEGVLPETDDSLYRRQASFVKFMGTTREVTHPMTLVRTAHGDPITQENQNGILWLMRQLEHALFWGDSKLAAPGREGVQFDGLNAMIDPQNTVDMAGHDLTDSAINYGAQMLIENFATPTDLFLPYEVMATFSEQYFPKERVIMPTAGGSLQAGLVVNKFNTHAGPVEFQPDLFLTKTKPLAFTSTGGVKAPTAPASVTAALGAVTAPAVSKFANSGAGDYQYSVTACNRYGESIPVALATAVTFTESDFAKGVTLTITNSASMAVEPEWFAVYRTAANGTDKYCIARVPAMSVEASGVTTFTDLNDTMPNTYTAFMGEMSPQILTFRQLAPIMKMDLALLSPSFRWMILLYGTPILFAPRKWVRFVNIKANMVDHVNGLYY